MYVFDRRIDFSRWLMLVYWALATSACASTASPAGPGERVELPTRSILESDRPSDQSVVIGELVRTSPDTACIREASDSGTRCFALRSGTRLSPKMPSNVSDPWLVGDSLRVRQRQRVQAQWAVMASRGDTLVLSGDSGDPLEMARASEASPVDGRLQRQVFRARPGAPLVLGAAMLGGGILWARHLKAGDPEPGGEFLTAGDLVVAMAVSGLIGGGAIAILASGTPRVGWDDLDVTALPIVRNPPSADLVGHSFQLGLKIRLR